MPHSSDHDGVFVPDAEPSDAPAEGAGGGLEEAEMLRRAEQAIAALKAEYPGWVERHIADLEEASNRARTGAGECAGQLEIVADIAHDVKGEGTTYGYPLMTAIGQALHRFAAGLASNAEACGVAQFDVIDRHIEAMRTVIRGRIEGDGGAFGEGLLAGLARAVAEAAGESVAP